MRDLSKLVPGTVQYTIAQRQNEQEQANAERDAALLQGKLGQAAINTETLYGALGEAIDQHINQAVTNTSLAQTSISSSMYDLAQIAKDNSGTLQNAVESSLAGQMGIPLENTATIAPTNAFVQSVTNTAVQNIGSRPAVPNQFAGAVGPVFNLSTNPNNPTPEPNWCQLVKQIGSGPIDNWIDNTSAGQGGLIGYVGRGGGVIGGPPIAAGGTQEVTLSRGVDPTNSGITGYVFTFKSPGPSGLWNGQSFCPKPGGPETPPPPPTTTTPAPSSCPPSSCPPVVKFPDCIKICDVTPKPPKKTEEPIYQFYCDKETGIMYAVVRDTPPKKTSDVLMTEGVVSGVDLQALCKQCKKPGQDDSGQSSNQNAPAFMQQFGCGGLFNFPELANPDTMTTFSGILKEQIDAARKRNGEINSGIAKSALDILYNFANDGVSWIDDLITGIGIVLAGGNCNQVNVTGMVTARALLGLCGRFVGNAVQPLDRQIEYALNSVCPFVLPTAEQATQEYLTDSIGIDRLRCLVEANGYKWEPWKSQVDASRTRWNPGEVLALWRRKKMDDGQADSYLRSLGYLNQGERDGLKTLTEQVPPISDLMTMMVRDVEDNINVDWTDSDRIFADKWKGQLKEWGYNQGIPDLAAKYAWRAHWTLPSPTQLFEFWHRLRNTGEFGTQAQFKSKIRGALIQQDILPEWIDPFLAVSFKPLTRVDAKRAYSIGTLDEVDLLASFKDQGYSDDNADTMVRYTKQQLKVATGKNPLIKRYASGAIDLPTLRDMLNEQGLNDEMIEFAVSVAERELQLDSDYQCVKAVKKRFLMGEFKAHDIPLMLKDRGLDATQISTFAHSWECQRTSRGKTIPAATLCQWYQDGAINEIDLYTRLQNLGYNQDDAAGLTRDCMIRAGKKWAKDQAAELKKANQQQHQTNQASKQAQKELDKAVAKADKEANKKESQRELRQKKCIQIGEVWHQKTGMPISESIYTICKIINRAIAQNLAPINVVITAAETAAHDPAILTFADFSRSLAQFLVDVAT